MSTVGPKIPSGTTKVGGGGILGRWKGLMRAVARPDAYAVASTESTSDAPDGSARLNPPASRAVNNPDIDCMIICQLWPQSYFNTA